MGTYVDTNALVKRREREPISQQRDFDRAYLTRLRGLFDNDLRGALWVVMPFPIETFAAVVRPIDQRCGLSIHDFSS